MWRRRTCPNSFRSCACGYALTRVSWSDHRLRRRRPLLFVPVRPRGRRWRELEALFEALSEVANDARGMTLAPARRFLSVFSQGVLLVVSDASRASCDDGVGGFASVAALPNECFVVSAAWPPFAEAALDLAASRRAQRQLAAPGAPMLSMPCAEIFGALLVAAAVVSHLGSGCCDAVTSVLDCRPAARAYTSAFSASAQIRILLYRARALCPHWLGVPVPR
ncbi:MAG: hypothetical protein SGPRY_007903 [Prymnesium sp.]